MTRTAAREIAVHFAFELGCTNQNAAELMAAALNRQPFHQTGGEDPAYTAIPK